MIEFQIKLRVTITTSERVPAVDFGPGPPRAAIPHIADPGRATARTQSAKSPPARGGGEGDGCAACVCAHELPRASVRPPLPTCACALHVPARLGACGLLRARACARMRGPRGIQETACRECGRGCGGATMVRDVSGRVVERGAGAGAVDCAGRAPGARSVPAPFVRTPARGLVGACTRACACAADAFSCMCLGARERGRGKEGEMR